MPTKSAALLRPKRRSLFSRKKSGALAEVDALFSSAATATHAAIVVGLVRRMSSGAFNSSRFYSPDGNSRPAVRALGIANLQGHGFSQTEPRICRGWREPVARPGVGFQS